MNEPLTGEVREAWTRVLDKCDKYLEPGDGMVCDLPHESILILDQLIQLSEQ